MLSMRDPPQTIISLPVQIAVCSTRAVGAFAVLTGVQLFVLGLYLAAGVEINPGPPPTPHNHFGTRPHRGVKGSARERVGSTGGRPTIVGAAGRRRWSWYLRRTARRNYQ